MISRSLLLLTCICLTAPAESIFYDFKHDETGKVLATLELRTLPAAASDVLRLTFTETGHFHLGFGAEFPGRFGEPARFIFRNKTVSDGMGGLQGQDQFGAFFESHHSASSLHFPFGVQRFQLGMVSMPGMDSMFAVGLGGPEDWRLVEGDWAIASIPEPSSSLQFTVGFLGLIGWRRKSSGGGKSPRKRKKIIE